MGTADLHYHNHPICYCLTTNENSENYSFLLSETLNFVVKNFDFKWEPNYALSDGAGAIKNAYKTIFPNAKLTMCHYHMEKNVAPKISMKSFVSDAEISKQSQFHSWFDNKKTRIIIRDHLNMMKYSPTLGLF